MALADLCYKKGMHATADRFWVEAFAERPALAEDMTSGNRYNAACSAAMAGSGKGKAEPAVDEAGRAKLRTQAIGWLKADLASHGKAVEGGKPEDRAAVAKTLAHWQGDTDLAGIRDEPALAALPEAERAELRAFWDEVARLLARAREAR